MKKLTVMIVALALSACGGGSGGSSSGIASTPPPPPPVQFTSFSALPANTEVEISGTSREGSFTLDAAGFVTTISEPTVGNASAEFVVNTNQEVVSLELDGRNSNLQLDGNDNSVPLFSPYTQEEVAVLGSNSDGSEQALFANPYTLGFDYQTFGVWGKGLVAGQSGSYGAMSVGARTAGSSVPTGGTARFDGVAGGIYIHPQTGEPFRYGANARFDVDFSSRAIDMSTFNQFVVSILDERTLPINSISLTASMTYDASSPNFEGSFAFGNSSGSGSGSFYGPGAEELGGTFYVSGGSGTLIGGFGGRR